MPLDLTCTNEEKIRVTVSPTTSTGSPASLDGAVSVEVSSGDATVELIDNASFFVVSGTNPGPSTFVVSADADLGSGVLTISDSINLNVAGAMASNLGMTAGTPEPK